MVGSASAGYRTVRGGKIKQHRLRRHVVVPHIVMHGLEVPHDLAARRVERDDGACIVIAAIRITRRAVETHLRVAGRDKHEVALGIGGEHRPGVGGRALIGAIGQGARRLRRHRIPGPQQCPTVRVECAHDTGGHIGAHVLGDTPADDHPIADDRRGHRHAVIARERVPEVCPQVHRACGTEVRAPLAIFRIERNEARVLRGGEDAAGAGRPIGSARVVVITDAAAHEQHRAGGVELRIKRPQLVPAFRIQRDDAIHARAQVQPSLGENRRGFESRQAPHFGRESLGEHAGHGTRIGRVRGHEARFPDAVDPGDFEVCDVIGRDLRHRRVAHAPLVAAPEGPAAERAGVINRWSARAAREQRQQNSNNPMRARHAPRSLPHPTPALAVLRKDWQS